VFPEVLYSRYVKRNGDVAGDIAFFDFGTCVFWNLTPAQERSILDASLHPYEEGKLSSAKVESDVFQFRLLPYAKPAIQNDLITLSPTLAEPHLMKLAISFALAQSTKLSVLEERALSIAEVTRRLPIALASEGRVRISDKAVAKLMGRVFMERAALNLLGSVLDTPDFFWESGVADSLQRVYDKVGRVPFGSGCAGRAWAGSVCQVCVGMGTTARCLPRVLHHPGTKPTCFCPPFQVFEYLEMRDRIDILNERLAVLHELLDMLRLQGQAQHSDFLEVIIILLICVDLVILLAQVAATLGLFGFSHGDHGALRGVGAVAAMLGQNMLGLGQ
jgi:uncharacterized Rmd1/YagE family protein